MFGATIGTTITALLVASTMNLEAKKVAIAHLLFSVVGVLIFLPFIGHYTGFVESLGGSPQQVVANAHMLFNISLAIIFLVPLKLFERFINKIV